mgnify:CR=1 FL=1
MEEEETNNDKNGIQENPKEEDVLDQNMLSTVSSIKKELSTKFPQETSDYFVFSKYSKNDRILRIFVSLAKQTKINGRKNSINFIIVINEEYPNRAPMVFCLSDVINQIYN